MRFQCPECGAVVAVDNTDLGIEVQCGNCSKIVTSPSKRVEPGVVIADFIIQKELGRGGMGVVYLAHQISLDRPAALKILSDAYTNNAEFVVGFIKEARAAAKLNHPHIVQAYAVGEDEGLFYFAMENIDGETMKDVLKREKIIPVDEAISIIQQIAEALNYAWMEQRLIHRDIKPDNIMLTSSGRAKLADLGLARVAGDIDDSESDEVMGTPQYISPEHLTGAPMDGRSDIYSLGATFYHFVTGRFAFEGKSAAEIAQKHLTEPLVPPNQVNPDVPECVSRIIEKMMAKDPIMRYQDAEALVDDLRIAKKLIETNGGKESSVPKGKIQLHRKDAGAAAGAKGGHHVAGHQHHAATAKSSMPSDNTASTDRLFSDDTVTEAVRKEKQKRMNKPLLVVVVAGVLLLVGIIAALIAAVFPSGEPEPKKPKPVLHATVKKTEPKSTKASTEMNSIIAYSKLNPGIEYYEYIRNRCETFLLTFNEPKYKVEETAFRDFLAIYSKVDEEFLSRPRKRVEQELEEKLDKKEALLKQEDERNAKVAALEAERKRQQAELEAKRKKEQEERAAQQKRIQEETKAALDELKTEMPPEKNRIMKEIFQKTSDEKFDEALKLAQEWKTTKIDEKLKDLPTLKGFLNPYDIWITQMIATLKDMKSIHEKAFSDGKDMAKVKITQNGKTYSIVEISKGKVVYKDGKAFFRIPVQKLDNESITNIIVKAAKLADCAEKTFMYLAMTGDYQNAKGFESQVTLPENKREIAEFRNLMRNLMKEIYQDAPERSKKKYREGFGKDNLFKNSFGN